MDEPVPAEQPQKVVLYLGIALFLSLLFSVMVLAIVQLSNREDSAARIQQETGETAAPVEESSRTEEAELEALEQELQDLDQVEEDLTPPELEFE